MDTDSIEDLKIELRESLVDLRAALNRHRLHFSDFAGDLALWGFMLGTWESGNAVFYLVDQTEFGPASFPCVWAAFENAQDALLLATDLDYNEAGARARVFERLEQADIADNTRAAFGDSEVERRRLGYDVTVAAIQNDAERWSGEHPKKGDLLLNALAHFQPKFEAALRGKKHPGHWSGLSRGGIAKELGKRLNDPEVASRMIAMYSALSRGSHPRLRLESWDKVNHEDGSFSMKRPERMLRMSLGITEFAIRLAIRAFSLKQPSPDQAA